MTPRQRRAWGGGVGLVALLIAWVQVRNGLFQILDAGSYASAADGFRSGRPLTSVLAPSFSNFSAIEFLQRDGRLPFVDFPFGFPLLGGLLGLVTGTRRAFAIIGLLASAALAAGLALAPRVRSTAADAAAPLPLPRPLPWAAIMRSIAALAVVLMPTYRLTVQGGLSEPLFCALAVWFAINVVRYDHDGNGLWRATAFGAALGLTRFVGAPLVLVLVGVCWRRERSWRRMLTVAALGLAPTAANVLWASAAGGGHSMAWRGIQRLDARLFARSVSGWVDAGSGDLIRTLLSVGDQVPWFGYPLVVAWAAAVGWALTSMVWPRAGWAMPTRSAVPLCMAGVLALTLFAGLATFDALATPDNRITLPIGVLTIAALVWWIPETVSARTAAWTLPAMALWAIVAARPERVDQLFAGPVSPAVTALASEGRSIVISNAADNVYWATGLRAAYLPPERLSLTGEPVDRAALFAQLPCALQAHDGIVALFAAGFLGDLGRAELEVLTASGELVADRRVDLVVYRPAPDLEGCP